MHGQGHCSKSLQSKSIYLCPNREYLTLKCSLTLLVNMNLKVPNIKFVLQVHENFNFYLQFLTCYFWPVQQLLVLVEVEEIQCL